MNVQERSIGGSPLPDLESGDAAGMTVWNAGNGGLVESPLADDRVSSPYPSQPSSDLAGVSNGVQNGPFGAILSQVFGLLEQLLRTIGVGTPAPAPDRQTAFQSARASSTGDPHLAFSGTTGTGMTTANRCDSMTSHTDLLDSDSFLGGYQVATRVSAPDARGVTYNASAMVTTNFGATQIELDASGNASIVQNGESSPLAQGQTLDLGNGERVSRDARGALTITDVTASGGSIDTVLSVNGSGVDVTAQARSVDLGGDLVGSQTGPYAPQSRPQRPVIIEPWRQPAAMP